MAATRRLRSLAVKCQLSELSLKVARLHVAGVQSCWASCVSVVCVGTSQDQLASFVEGAALSKAGPNQQCTRVMDLVLLIDDSASISKQNFEAVRKFVVDFLKLVPISEEEVHASLVTFSHTTVDVFTFKNPEGTNQELAVNAMQNLKHRRGFSTSTDEGIDRVGVIFTESSFGARAGVPKVLVLMTDGESNSYSDTKIAADKIRTQGVSVFVVGVGAAYPAECRAVVGCDSEGACPQFIQSNWSGLVNTVESIMAVVCKRLPKDAECSEWSEWSTCTATCGPGTRERRRKQLAEPVEGSAPCPTCSPLKGKTCEELGGLRLSEGCNLLECPVDAGCGEWGEWTAWAASCGHAIRSRKRVGYNTPPPRGTGVLCEQKQPPVPSEESEEKDFGPCPVNQVPGDWTDWSVCTATCGGGTRHRTRSGTPQVGELYGGQTLEEQGFEVRQEEKCGESACPVDATCGELGEWSVCSRSCGGGTSVRRRDPWENNQQHGGKSCDQQFPEGREQQKECNLEPCPVDEVAGEWLDWSTCSVSCGQGTMTRKRGPSPVKAQFGGKTIAQQNETSSEQILMEEQEDCVPFPCGPCAYEFGPWTECEGTCAGGGTRVRHTAVRFDYPDEKCSATTAELESCVPKGCEAEGGAAPVPGEGAHDESASSGAGENTTNTNEKAEEDGVPAAAIAGGVVGGVLLLAAAGGGAYYMTGSAASGAAGASASPDVSGEHQVREVEQEEREAVINVDEDGDMWSA
ncbi:microneme protein MIC2 [Besnoitia besnoiti]|uniref:Microneme protein MIC2 n=1 Tax=Besnoitia besnoiti TaxID=94643 RepID=A0A2A9MKI1_BESBE|nr:microneme protein MIC2 [Besnoitia besnoiti]PFH38439.1 microneme protein MIC2 [Besnoitia besnoiti]